MTTFPATDMHRNTTSDLRLYIEALQARGEVNVVDREVDPKFELAAVVGRSQKENDRPILFNNVKGSKFPVIANVYGSFARIAEMVDANGENLNVRWTELVDSMAGCSADYINEVSSSAGRISCKLTDLPHITYREKDAGPYITAGVFLAQ